MDLSIIYASNFIQNKGVYFYCNLYKVLHEFWWHDYNILPMDLCGTLCTPGQVLGHKNMIKFIINFFYIRAPNKLNTDLGFQHFINLLRFTIWIQDWISIQFSIHHADHIHILCQLWTDPFRSINPTQIHLIFESMQYCRNDQEREKLPFFVHATYF